MVNTLGLTWRAVQQQLVAAGLNPAPQEGKTLLAHVLGCAPTDLLVREHEPLPAALQATLAPLVARRVAGEPLTYVLGQAWFFGHAFLVSPAVLIPRPDTEILVQAVLNRVAPAAALVGLDVGVGSGAVVGSLAHALPRSQWWGTDASGEVLSVAQDNLERLRVADRVQLIVADIVPPRLPPLDVLVSNPPYVAEAEYAGLEPSVRGYEPKLALTGAAPNPDGLVFYRRLAGLRSALKPGGLLALEIGHTQGPAVAELLVQHGWYTPEILTDLAGRPRVVVARG